MQLDDLKKLMKISEFLGIVRQINISYINQLKDGSRDFSTFFDPTEVRPSDPAEDTQYQPRRALVVWL